MMSPPLRFNVAPRRKAFLLVWFWHRQSRMVNLESRLEVFVICFCCGHVGNFFCVVQAQRHVDSAICSGLSAAGFTASPQLLPLRVVDEIISEWWATSSGSARGQGKSAPNSRS
jgi:hypothetical protein